MVERAQFVLEMKTAVEICTLRRNDGDPRSPKWFILKTAVKLEKMV